MAAEAETWADDGAVNAASVTSGSREEGMVAPGDEHADTLSDAPTAGRAGESGSRVSALEIAGGDSPNRGV